MPYAESHSVQFRWGSVQRTQLTRFLMCQTITKALTRDVRPVQRLLTILAVMQFALRYDFY